MPAPVQASWLGYFASTGVAAIDYFVADPRSLPETEELHFNEKIWRLPRTRLCFTPPDVNKPVSPLPALKNGHITFACINNLTKINDSVIALWARILNSLAQSRLFLKADQLDNLTARQDIADRFAAHGIAGSRLILEGASPRSQYLDAYSRVDLALDPFPFNGGTTSADTDDYVARAVAHTSDLQRLAALRNGLRQQVLGSPLFNTTGFAEDFEAALRGMWTQWCKQQLGRESALTRRSRVIS